MRTLAVLSRRTFFMLSMCTFSAVQVSAAERPSDEAIVTRVRSAFFEDPRVRASDIKVTAANGIVTLEGTVRTIAEMQYADLESKKIRGVFGVIDRLAVQPIFRLDAEIRQDLKRKIVRSSLVKSENIGVHVENGIVFLSGIVGSTSEKNQAYLLAAEVRGVKAVENRIEVQFATKRPDAVIRKDVMAKLAQDVYLAGSQISVETKNGNVTLTGDLGTVFEKERAGQDAASIFNVNGVKNDIAVVWSKSEGARNKAPALSDTELTVAAGNELSFDTRLDNPKDMSIAVRHGIVTLSGTAPTYYQKQLAERDLSEVVGVVQVNNLLQVKGVWRDDMGIYMDIRDALSSDFALNGSTITFFVLDGVVSLNGNINSVYEKNRIEKDIGGIIGVKDIRDYITVNWMPAYSDDALKNRIFERLLSNWITWQLAKTIIVNVNQGIATLTGTTQTKLQAEEAGIIAGQTDGIKSVDNKLVASGN